MEKNELTVMDVYMSLTPTQKEVVHFLAGVTVASERNPYVAMSLRHRNVFNTLTDLQAFVVEYLIDHIRKTK